MPVYNEAKTVEEFMRKVLEQPEVTVFVTVNNPSYWGSFKSFEIMIN